LTQNSGLPGDQPITALLRECAAGNRSALDRLIPLMYPELQRLARSYMRNERKGHTLQPTALVHEAYARLTRQDQPDYRSRSHFMGVAAHIMRQILIDHARARASAKRGAGEAAVPLEQSGELASGQSPEIIAVDDALQALARKDPLKAQLVEMRFFGGMTAEESAEVLGRPVAEIRRHLRVGQAWLKRELDRTHSAEKDAAGSANSAGRLRLSDKKVP
jgi:RNA polymerase sigma factor (TIGR02999 family)